MGDYSIDMDSTPEIWGASDWLNGVAGAKGGIKTVKAGLKLAGLLDLVDLKADYPWNTAYRALDTSKKMLNTVEIPHKLVNLYEKTIDLITKHTWYECGEFVAAVTSLIGSVQDTVEMIFSNMTAEQAQLLDQIGGVSLGTGMSWLIFKDVRDITHKVSSLNELKAELAQAEVDRDEQKVAKLKKFINGLEAQTWGKVINVAQWLSFAALSALTIAATFYSVAVSPWLYWAASTSATFFSIVGHFYNVHVVDPIFDVPTVERPDGFRPDELREYHKAKWNHRPLDGEKHPVHPVDKLPKKAEKRLQHCWSDGIRGGLGWELPPREPVAADA